MKKKLTSSIISLVLAFSLLITNVAMAHGRTIEFINSQVSADMDEDDVPNQEAPKQTATAFGKVSENDFDTEPAVKQGEQDFSQDEYDEYIETTLFSIEDKTDNNYIISESSSKKAKASLMGSSSYFLNVSVLDMMGNPAVGADVLLVEQKGSAVRCMSELHYITEPDGTTKVFVEKKEGYTYGIIVYGHTPDPSNLDLPWEPFFTYVPFSSETNLTVNMAEQEMKKIEFQSLDEKGEILSVPHYNAIYIKNQNGLRAGLLFNEIEYGRRTLWLPYADYEYQTFINATEWGEGWQENPLYYMTENIYVDEQMPDSQILEIGGSNLIECLFSADKGEVTPIQAFTLFSEEGSMSPVFYHTMAQGSEIFSKKILLTPGTYKAQGVYTCYEQSGSWNLWIENELELQENGSVEWTAGSTFSAEITAEENIVGNLETIEFENNIYDEEGNRLIAAACNFSFVGWEDYLNHDTDSTLEKYEVVPFIVIRDHTGKTIFRYKNAGDNNEILTHWQSWSVDNGTINCFPEETTFFTGSYTIPEDLIEGVYGASLELDLGSIGGIYDETNFTVISGPGIPVLDAQISPTNSQSITISGKASLNSEVKVSYRLDGGESIEAASTYTDESGRFEVTLTLLSEGEYKITAVAVKSGETGMESTPVTVVVDRTAPGIPKNVEGFSPDEETIHLTWEASEGEAVSYEILRNGSLVGTVSSMSEKQWSYRDEGLIAGTEYEYEVIAVDSAGNNSEPAKIKLTTQEPINIQITSVKWAGSWDNHNHLNAGTNLDITIVGTAEKTAKAIIEYMHSSGVKEKVELVLPEIDDENNQEETSTYKGTVTIPDGAGSIEKITGVVFENNNNAEMDTDGLPIPVNGGLKVKMSADTLDKLQGFNNAELSLWSNSKKVGEKVKIDDSSEYILTGLMPSGDYELKLVSGSINLREYEDIEIIGGLMKEQVFSFNKAPATLELKIIDEEGNAFYNTDWNAQYSAVVTIESSDNVVVAGGYPAHDGWVRSIGQTSVAKKPIVNNGIEGETYRISVKVDRKIQDYMSVVETVTLLPGENVKNIIVPKRPKAVICGTVKNQDGDIISDAIITAYANAEDGSLLGTQTITDEKGEYSIEVFTGKVYLRVMHTVSRTREYDLELPLEKDEIREYHISVPIERRIMVELKYRSIGDIDFIGQDKFTQQMANITIKNTGREGTPKNFETYVQKGIALFYPVPLAEPGDIIEVTVDETDQGYAKQTETVILDENSWGRISMVLVEQGKIKVQLKDVYNKPIDYKVWATIYKQDDNDLSYVSKYEARFDEITSGNLEQGEYTVILHTKAPLTNYPYEKLMGYFGEDAIVFEDVLVEDNQITSLGLVGIEKKEETFVEFFKEEEGNQYRASDYEVSPGKLVTLTAKYSYSTTHPVIVDLNFFVDIPQGSTYIEDSLVIKPANNTKTPEVTLLEDNGKIDIIKLHMGGSVLDGTQIEEIEGVIIFQVRFTDNPESPWSSSRFWASFYNTSGGLNRFTQETIGEVLIKAPYVSISVPAFIKDRTVPVSGNAPKGSNIKIYDSSYLVGEAIANHFGVWDTIITLPNRGDPYTHYLMAECFNKISGQPAYSETVSVEYDSNRPIITKIVLTVNDFTGKTVEELKPNSKFTYMVFYTSQGSNVSHEIDVYFDDSSRIIDFELLSADGLRLISKESIIHNADENKFSGSWSGVQPVGEIRASYRTKKEPWKISDYEPIEEDVQRSDLPPLWGNATVIEPANELLYNSEKDNLSMSSKVMLGDRNTVIETTMEISNYTGELPVGYSPDSDLPIGNLQYEIREDDTFEITFIVPTALLLQEEVLQQAQNFETKSLLAAAPVVSLLSTRVPNQLVKVFGKKTVIEAGLDVYSIHDTAASGSASNRHLRLLEELKKQVNSPCYHAPYQFDYEMDRDDIEWQQSRTQSRTVVKSILTVGFLALSFVPVGGWAVQLGVAVGTTIVGHLIDKHMEKTQNEEYEALRARIDSRIKPECKEKKKVSDSEYLLGLKPSYRIAKPLIDPSGYVYEGVESNRIEGVTASALVKVEGEWLLWDSEWTGQKNPLLTDSVGFYKWDVPEGWWKVMYEKEGYEIAFSEELPVPPPQLEVNVGIVSLAPPSVTEIKAEHGGIINLIFDKYMQTDMVTHDTFKIYDEMTDDKGNNVLIAGTITAVDAEPDPKNENVMFARTFQFISDVAMNTGDICNVWVSKMVQSYADVTMSDDYSESVTIPEKVIEVESVSLNKTEFSMHPGESVQLTAEVLPTNADDISVSWSSDNPEIADVDNSGLVNANSKGSATITVTTSDGGFTDICLINVVSKPTSGHTNTTRNVRVTGIDLNKTELSLMVGGDSFKLSATIIPTNAKNKNVVWSTNNKDVAVVENGMVTPVGEGKAIITVKSVDGNYSVSCNVIVEDESDKFSETIGIETTEITAFDEEILLTFESSTFLSETKIDVKKIIDKKDIGNLVIGSSVFDIAFEGATPAKPILLRMKYSPEEKIDPLKFGIYWWDDNKSKWSYICGAINTENGFVQGTINKAGKYAVMAYEKTFTDILNHWSRKDIEVLTSRYVINGINENEFAPDLEITRAEFIKLIMSMEPLREVVETKTIQQSQIYTDVESGKWYFPYIEAATEMGIATGYDGFFRPDSPITREEMTVMVLRALNRDARIKQTESDSSLSHFADADTISDWALDYVTLATEKGIIQGDTNRMINPKGFTTRAEAAVVILRTMENLGFVVVTPTTTEVLE